MKLYKTLDIKGYARFRLWRGDELSWVELLSYLSAELVESNSVNQGNAMPTLELTSSGEQPKFYMCLLCSKKMGRLKRRLSHVVRLVVPEIYEILPKA